jgi:MORN repeat
MSKAALPEDSDEERERKERERRLTLGKLYPLAPPRWLPPILDTEEYGAGSSDYVLGVHTYEDGSVYAGEWRRGMRSGWGVYESAKPKVKYSGEWRTNRYDGLGIVTYPTGNRYEGEFLADQRHGRGLFLWKTTVRRLRRGCASHRVLTLVSPARAKYTTAAGSRTCAQAWAATTGRTAQSTRASGPTACPTGGDATYGATVRAARLSQVPQPSDAARCRAAV